jgi:predicted ATPase
MRAWDTLWFAALLGPALNPDASAEDVTMASTAAKQSLINGGCFFEAETTRSAGLRLMSGDAQAGEDLLRDAVDMARRQDAKSLELRESTSLARLFVAQGRHGAARSLLAPIYSWFSEGFDIRDLKQAKLLFEELS